MGPMWTMHLLETPPTEWWVHMFEGNGEAADMVDDKKGVEEVSHVLC